VQPKLSAVVNFQALFYRGAECVLLCS